MSASTSAIPLTPAVISVFKPSKVFTTHNSAPFSSLSFDGKGDFLITAAEDETMQLYNCKTGKHQKQLYSKKYGVHLARFTHKSTAIIHASTKEDGQSVESSYEERYSAFPCSQMEFVISPFTTTTTSDTSKDTKRGPCAHLQLESTADGKSQPESLLSKCRLRTTPSSLARLTTPYDCGIFVRRTLMYVLRAQRYSIAHAALSQGLLNIAGHPSAAYEPSGLVFAVALNLRSSVLFYDQRFYDKAPFLSVAVVDLELSRHSNTPRIPIFTSLKFSNDGKYLLLGTGGDHVYVLNAFSGDLLVRLDCQSLLIVARVQ